MHFVNFSWLNFSQLEHPKRTWNALVPYIVDIDFFAIVYFTTSAVRKS